MPDISIENPSGPPGLKLRQTLLGHSGYVGPLAWSPDGALLASGSGDTTVRIWNPQTGLALHVLGGHTEVVTALAWSSDGRLLASGSADHTIRIWKIPDGSLARILSARLTGFIRSLEWLLDSSTLLSGSEDDTIQFWNADTGALRQSVKSKHGWVLCLKRSPQGTVVACGFADGTVVLMDNNGKSLFSLRGHRAWVDSLAWSPDSKGLASGSGDNTVRMWSTETRRTLSILEAHTEHVRSVTLSADGSLLASKSDDDTIRVWGLPSGETLATVAEHRGHEYWPPSISFHPLLPVLATIDDAQTGIRVWDIDADKLQRRVDSVSIRHTTAKIVLVGNSGVGKTGLGWRLAYGAYRDQSSTHGQQFWVLNQIGTRRADGTECEAILWDLAGQPDYRLTHALFIDDADLALILFDPTDGRDPLYGVEFWLRQLETHQASGDGQEGKSSGGVGCEKILIAARVERGAPRLTLEELDAFCRDRNIRGGFIATSAKEDIGLDELLRRMKESIPWEQKTATVTTQTFKRIKDYVLGLKESGHGKEVLVGTEDLRERLQKTDNRWFFTDIEMITAIKHLSNYGYIRVLRTAKGEERVLLVPELLNNLAASFVLEARRNPRGLGSLEERLLHAGDYRFRELDGLTKQDRDTLIRATAQLFLQHNICFRETDPLGGQSYLIFPELINLKKPLAKDERTVVDGVSYTVSGAVENIFASLVVLLGYTQTFTRTDQWENQARYVVGDGLICGFRRSAERDGGLELVLYFGTDVGRETQKLFEALIENFLTRRGLSISRVEPVSCPNGHVQNRETIKGLAHQNKQFAFCPECGEKIALGRREEPTRLNQTDFRMVDEEKWIVTRRSKFEQVLLSISSYVDGLNQLRPDCFVSYAWGEKNRELWVEKTLAADLQKAGITVVLDRWENARIGSSVARFVDRIEKCSFVIVVGTPLYRRKYENKDSSTGYVVAAEVDMIANRMLGTEQQKASVLPLLLDGEKVTALPPLLHGRVFGDFRNDRAYFTAAFDLILSLYAIPFHDNALVGLRASLDEVPLKQDV
jgi:WD40 repeat protein